MGLRERLGGSYWMTLVVSLLALSPSFILSAALGPVEKQISSDLGVSMPVISWGSTLSPAALAVGAVFAADLSQRFRGRPLFAIYELVFIAGSAVTALAPAAWLYVVGHIAQGLGTGLLLVAALPPLITTFPTYRLKTTFPAVVIGLFGAVTAGPLVGGYVAQTGAWRLMFAATVLLGVVVLALALVSLPERQALNPDLPVDAIALTLATAGTALAFYGVGQLMGYGWASLRVYPPMALGLLLLALLFVVEFRRSEPLMPTRPLVTIFPVMGILAAVISGAAFTGLVGLLTIFLTRARGMEPLATGLLFWPSIATGLLGALIVGAVLATRWVLAMPLVGMAAMTAAAWLLTGVTGSTGVATILLSTALLGLGASLTVTPGLLMAALSVVPKLVGRAIALVELMRLVSAYLASPVITYFALANGAGLLAGLHAMFSVVLWTLVGGIGLITAIYLIGGASIHPPGLEAFLEHGEPALKSPPLDQRRRKR